ncbi:MAG TPA: hypothetical protein VGE52_06765 [Pirellulales bacterium]
MADAHQTTGGTILAAIGGFVIMAVVGAFNRAPRNLRHLQPPPVRATADALVPHPALARQAAQAERLAQLRGDGSDVGFPSPSSAPAAPAPTESFSLTTDPAADEALFYVRRLEVLLSLDNLLQADKADVPRIALSQRRNLAAAAEAVRTANLDPAVLAMYDEAAGLLDCLADCLIDLGLLASDYNATATAQARSATLRATESAATTGGEFLASGADPWTAGGAALVQAAVVSFDHSAQAEKLKARRTADVQRRVDEMTIDAASRLDRIRTIAVELAARRGWSRAEVGFLDHDPRPGRAAAALGSGDYIAMNAVLEELLRSRPRDPFLHYGCAQMHLRRGVDLLAISDSQTAAAFERAGELYLSAAELLPAGRAHDPLRVQCLIAYAECLNQSVYCRRRPRSLGVAVCEAALALDPEDASGEIRRTYADALARAGRPTEAVQSFERLLPTLGRGAESVYALAYLRSLAGDADGSLAALREARSLGLTDVRRIRRDLDLKTLQATRGQEFRELVRPKWTWKIEFGVWQNDVLVENDSDFDFTHVLLEVVWTPQQGPARTELLWADRIAAGTTHRFEAALDGCVSTRMNNAATTARLVCWESLASVFSLAPGDFNGAAARATRLVRGVNSSASGPAIVKLQPASSGGWRIFVSGLGVAATLDASDSDVARGWAGQADAKVYFDADRIYGWIIDRAAGDVIAVSTTPIAK